jgi:Tol biopolymer transport system component
LIFESDRSRMPSVSSKQGRFALAEGDFDVKNSNRIAIISIAAALCAAVLLAPLPGQGQATEDEKTKAKSAAKAKAIAQAFELNARTLTVFDRQGAILNAVGPRGLYAQPVFSPDAKRLAVGKADLEKETQDLWVFDVATGSGIQLTAGQPRESAAAPAWSPDGSQVAYVAVRGGNFGLYRRASNGQGPEELLYKLPGLGTIVDWSMDGRYLSFFSTDLSGGAVFVLPVTATGGATGGTAGEPKPIEVFRSPKQVQGGRLSPDGRFVVYVSNESGKNEVYVRAFNAAAGAAAGPWKISDQGGQGMAFWRRDGKQLYYLAADRSVMAVEVSTSPAFEFGKPKVLFRPADSVAVAPGTASVSRDGERFVIAVPPPQLRQLTIFDRQGKSVKTVGEPGVYLQPRLSPDGSRVVAMSQDPKTGNQDIWTFDVATGKSYSVTADAWPDAAPVWSPDGTHVAYVSVRDEYSGIYRKAWDGKGEEELLYRYTPGAFMVFTDWSKDGRFLTFYNGVLFVVPLRANEKALERKAIEWIRDEFNEGGAAFSPDMRYVAYLSDEADPLSFDGSGSSDVYVRPFDAAKPEAPGSGPAARVSKNGVLGMVNWREDGKEIFFLNRDWEVMAADVTTTPSLQVSNPKVLFKVNGPLPGNPGQWTGVGRDGQRFVFAMPVAGPAR